MRLSHVLQWFAIATLTASIGVLSACKRAPPTTPVGAPVDQTPEARPPALSDAERRYGVSPTRSKEVTYQPDVIVMEHGADAIRSQTTKYGLGFAIPNWAQKAVNIFLGLFHAKPISTTYGTELGSVPIQSVNEAVPPSCAAKPE